MSEALLSIEHLSVDYVTHGQWTTALRDFSLTIQPGEAVGLVGPSGSGKSTVALAILRLIRAREGRITAGRILYKGNDLLALPDSDMRRIRGRDIAMIFQDPFTSLNPVLRVRVQLAEVLRAHGRPAEMAILDQSMRDVQLEPGRVLESYPHQLSGGQRQRVMIAMALLCGPKLLLADEPTTALDVIVQKEVLDVLAHLRAAQNVALLLISHQEALVSRYTQRVHSLLVDPLESRYH